MSRLTFHMSNFTYPATAPEALFATVVAQAAEADASGFDRVTVMDHFYQLPQIGRPEENMFEAYTLLAALAQHTTKVRLATLVTGNTYRNPAMLAKAVTALDVVSGGRATLGIGAGWYELEHAAMGYDFGTFTDRFEKLEEALQIVIPMLRGQRPSLEGEHYQVSEVLNAPAPLSRIPVMIGGGGERKTLRMVAQYADESNLVGVSTPAEIAHKLEVLGQHCERLGRDRSEISVSVVQNVCIAPSQEEAEIEMRRMIELKGWPTETYDRLATQVVIGDPDALATRLDELAGTGIDGLVLSAMGNGFVPGRVTLLGETASKVFGR